jgi:hypothetical protein
VLTGSGTEALGGAVSCFTNPSTYGIARDPSFPRASLESIVASRSDHATPQDRPESASAAASIVHLEVAMPDPFLLIVGLIAIACLALYPIRIWRRRTHRYDDDDGGGDVPLAPPPRRNDG